MDNTPQCIFGFHPTAVRIENVVDTVLRQIRSLDDGVGLLVTPNIDHIEQLRKNRLFRSAYENAEIVLCDGFPVHYYALAKGLEVHRITGCELVNCLFSRTEFLVSHRLFFVVDSERTKAAIKRWALELDFERRVMVHVPPFGFDADAEASAELVREIRGHSTTILIMAVGAPRSEIFVESHRHLLPSCWAICVGQAVKAFFGIVTRAPPVVRGLHAEWLWRLLQEPRRLLPRYMRAAIGFTCAVLVDFRRS
jgi:N-acetylglucosaminyldiphosphoundecaprenol N-acetyl-beta-D-mannosaminyltransferase